MKTARRGAMMVPGSPCWTRGAPTSAGALTGAPSSAASLDSPSGKTAAQGGERGDEGGKNLHGRQRHVGVDPLGRLLAVVVTSAALDDAVAAPPVLVPLGARLLSALGRGVGGPHGSPSRAPPVERHGRARGLASVRRPHGAQGFVLVPTRWGVERTFAGLGRYRRYRRDDERHTASRGAMRRVSTIHLMLKRLEPSNVHPPCRYRVAAWGTFRRDSEDRIMNWFSCLDGVCL